MAAYKAHGTGIKAVHSPVCLMWQKNFNKFSLMGCTTQTLMYEVWAGLKNSILDSKKSFQYSTNSIVARFTYVFSDKYVTER